ETINCVCNKHACRQESVFLFGPWPFVKGLTMQFSGNQRNRRQLKSALSAGVGTKRKEYQNTSELLTCQATGIAAEPLEGRVLLSGSPVLLSAPAPGYAGAAVTSIAAADSIPAAPS